jgi:NitT/TauT family transport system substrate-binding protein
MERTRAIGNTRMMYASRRGVLLGAIAAGAASCAPPSSGRAVNIAMGTWIGYGLALVARDENLFDGLNLNVSVVDDGTALVGSLNSGQVDLIGTTLDQFVPLRANGMPAQLIMVTDESYGGDGIAAAPGINTLADLRGKRIAYVPGPSSEYVLATALLSVGISMDQVSPVPISDPQVAVGAWNGGEVDAICIYQPFLAQTSARQGSKLLCTTRDFPEVSLGCFLVREGAENRDDLVSRFIAGIRRAEAFTAANLEAANAHIVSGFGVPADAIQTMRDGVRLKGTAENATYLNAVDGAEPRALPLMRSIYDYFHGRGRANDYTVSTADISTAAGQAFLA